MSKLVIYLLIILKFYCFCGIKFPPINLKKLDVKLGEEFTLRFRCSLVTGFSWTFLNENEVSGSIQFLRSKFEASPEQNQNIVAFGKKGYFYFYFKAIKVTNEVQTLKFTNVRLSDKKKNILTYTIKVNVK